MLVVDAGVFLFFTLFQVAGVGLLLRHARSTRRTDVATLALLLAINAVVTACSFSSSVGIAPETMALVGLAIDAPTGLVLFAYLCADRSPRWMRTFLAAGALLVVAVLAEPSIASDPITGPLLLALPYFVGLGLLLWRNATGSEEARWIAFAFLSRALLFGSQSIFGTLRGTPPETLSGALTALANVALMVCAIVAAIRLRRASMSNGPSGTLIVAALLLGPADALAMSMTIGTPGAPIASAILNYVTLAFVRPLFLYVAFARPRVWSILAHATFAAGVGTLILAAAPWISFALPVAAVLAFSIGSLTLAILQGMPTHEPSVAVPLQPDGRPHWKLLLLALHAADAGKGGPPRPVWTQSQLAAAVGISPQRVSEFPASLHETAAIKLDAFVPGWRAAVPPSAAAPTLVTVHRGIVTGMRGVRVYYRLTPLGEALAKAVDKGDPAPLSGTRSSI